MVALLTTCGGATNLGRVKKNGNRDFGREEDEVAELGQGRTLSGDLSTKFSYFSHFYEMPTTFCLCFSFFFSGEEDLSYYKTAG